MAQSALELHPRETVPIGFGPSSVGSELIRVAQEKHKTLSVMVGQWEMILTFFKHALEIPLCSNPDNSVLKDNHRTVLTAAMGFGENILTQSKGIDDSDLRKIGYSREFIQANVRYLRDTYQQWYVERDKEAVEENYKIICNAFAGTTSGNS